MAKWFGAHCNQEVRFSSAVMCKKWPQVPTSLLNNRRNYYYYYYYYWGLYPCLRRAFINLPQQKRGKLKFSSFWSLPNMKRSASRLYLELITNSRLNTIRPLQRVEWILGWTGVGVGWYSGLPKRNLMYWKWLSEVLHNHGGFNCGFRNES